MEGNSSDSIDSGSNLFSKLSAQRSISSTLCDESLSIAGSNRTRSAAITTTMASSKSELGDDGLLERSVSVEGEAEMDFTPGEGERTLSPLRRGPGRPRKDTGTGNSSPRGRSSGLRLRGNARGRMKSNIMTMQQSNLFGSSATGSPGGRSSSSPFTASSYYGVEMGSSFDEESNQASDPVLTTNRDATRCAFCYLTASSRLGQGDLIHHEPTPGFNLSALAKKITPKEELPISISDATNSAEDPAMVSESGAGATSTELTLRINLRHSKVVRARKKADIYAENELLDEIDRIGLPDDVELTDLFEPTGHCWAHHCCASWSDGVVQSETYALLHVDNAVAAAMTQKCGGCGRLGASITCRAKSCGKKFHYPCASAYGGFQDIKTLAFLCFDHLGEVTSLSETDASCANCETIGDLSNQLFCTSCGDHYHANCLDPPIGTSVTVRAGWQCPECKMCQHCQHYGDDSKMLVCDSCDKGYHVYCMQPPMTTIPKNGWKCKNCRLCTDCGSRTPGNGQSSRWHLNYSVCDSCYQQRNKGLFCPLCERAYRHLKLKSMRQCLRCKKYVHLDCIKKSISKAPESQSVNTNPADYICLICQGGGSAGQVLSPSQSQSTLGSIHQSMRFQELATTPSSSISLDEIEEEAETEMLAMFMKNEMAGGESLSGTESPFPELDVNLGDMDVDNVMQLLEPEEGNDFSMDFSFSATTEGRRGRGGSTAGGLKKQAILPRKRFSASGRMSSRTKSSSCSSSVAGSIRGGGALIERRRISRGGGGSGRGSSANRGAINALQSTLQTMISNHGGNVMRKKDDDEYIHTVIVSANDEFVFSQDICVICGSFGKGLEGYLIACMQCGQCYHPYCANVTINLTILRRGWRCLDCTVCEGCGRGDDEQHLLLCDECDVSFHTYCLDPPLDMIPVGAWICKSCSSCQACGSILLESDTTNFPAKLCARCDSAVVCPVCTQKYGDGDLIIQCETCEKWCHGKCNNLTTEDAVDKAADKGFKCWICRSNFLDEVGAHDALGSRNSATFGKAVDSSFHVIMDGVSLTKSGLRTVQWRPRRRAVMPAQVPASAASMSNLDDVIDSVHALVTRGLDDHGSGISDDAVIDERIEVNDTDRMSLNTAGGENYSATDPGLLSPNDKKKLFRQRKYLRVGIGGFLVRQTRQRSINEKPDEAQVPQELLPAESLLPDDGRESAGGDVGQPGTALVKPKKRRRQMRKLSKLQLEDNYPSYIQDAFFGTNTRPSVNEGKLKLDDQESPLLQMRAVGDNELEALAPPPSMKLNSEKHGASYRRSESTHAERHTLKASIHSTSTIRHGSQQAGSVSTEKASTNASQDSIGNSFEDLGEGDDIFPHQMDIHHHEFSNLIDMLMGDGVMDPVGQEDGEHRQSPNLENLIDSRDYVGIGEVDSAEMDRLMGNMLDDELQGSCESDPHSRQQPILQHQLPVPHGRLSAPEGHSIMQPDYHQQQSRVAPRFDNDMHQHVTHTPLHQQQLEHPSCRISVPSTPQNRLQEHQHPSDINDFGQDPCRFLSNPQQQIHVPVVHPMVQETDITPHGAVNPAISPKSDATSGADSKTYFERWEPDEALGDRATIAAVLYANTSHPDLRLKYPTWIERAKQIAKLWRLLAPEQRQQYVQLARENRAACRQVIKAKKATSDQASRHQTSTPQGSSSGQQSAEHHGFPPGPSMQDYKASFPDNQMDVSPVLRSATGEVIVGSPTQSFGTGPPLIRSQHPAQSRPDEFKVPQTPTGSIYRHEVLKRSESMPQTSRMALEANIKLEPQQQTGTFDQAMPSPSHHPTYNYSQQPAFQGSIGSLEQQGGNQAMEWNRSQQSLLEDFIEMEKRDQRSHHPSHGDQSGISTPSPIALGQPHWPGAPVQHVGPRPPAMMLQRQRSLGNTIMTEGVSETSAPLPRDPQREEWLSKTQHQHEIQMRAVEAELNQLRKSKKNIASKQRQLKKNGMELPSDESGFLARLNQDISERQKQLEHLRKQVKQHQNLIQEYNTKHGLVDMPPSAPPTPVAHRPLVPPGTPVPPAAMVTHSRSSCGPEIFDPHQQFLRPMSASVALPVHSAPHFTDPMGMPMQHRMPAPFCDPYGRPAGPTQMMNVMQQSYPPTGYRPNAPYIRQQQPPISSMSSVFSNVGMTMALAPSLATTSQQQDLVSEPKKKKKYYGKKKADNVSKNVQSAVTMVGNQPFGSETSRDREGSPPCPPSNLLAMAPDYNVDVVLTVSYLLDKTVLELDGPSSAAVVERENLLLRRVLNDSFAMDLSSGEDGKKAKEKEISTGKRIAPVDSGQNSPKKRQRKLGGVGGPGSKGKSTLPTSQSSVDSHSVFLERLTSQLKTLPPLTIQEPTPRSDPLIPNIAGVTQLVHRAEKPLLTGNGPGNMRLTFMPDYFLDIFNKPSKPQGLDFQRMQYQQQQAILQQQVSQTGPAVAARGMECRQPFTPGLQQPLHLPIRMPIGLGQIPTGMNRPLDAGDNVAGNQMLTGGNNITYMPTTAGFGFNPIDGTVSQLESRSLAESPLEVIYGDTPEFDEEPLPLYPALKPIMPAEGRLSPNFRLVAPVPMRAVPPDPPSLCEQPVSSSVVPEKIASTPDNDDNMVSVTLTLDPSVLHTGGVHEVLRGLAALLQIDVPKQFDVHIDTPPHTPEKELLKEATDFSQRKQELLICRYCEAAVQQATIHKKLAELGLTPKEDDTDDVIFCSQRCLDQFAARLKAPAVTVNETRAITSIVPSEEAKSVAVESRTTDAQLVDKAVAIETSQAATSEKFPKAEPVEDNRLDEIIKSVLGDAQTTTTTVPSLGSKEEVIHVKDLPRLRDPVSGDEISRVQGYEKRWRGTKWKQWSGDLYESILMVIGFSIESMYEQISKTLFRPAMLSSDVRVCDFCASVGDAATETCGRLLNLDAGRWVHVNCALWSAEVYERVEGALVNVEKAVRRAFSNVCCHCQRYGASIPCYKLRCDKSYHLPCAVENGCTFLKDKTMLCPNHAAGTSEDVILKNLAVIRRVYVERDENRIIAKLYQQGDSGELALRVGSLIFGHIGQLLPHQLRNFHVKDFIYPAGYSASRIYWSSKDVNKRNIYLCNIVDNDTLPEFRVSFHEENFTDITYTETSASAAWNPVLKSLEELRMDAGMLKLFSNYLSGEILFGLTESAIVKMIESLPGVDMMPRYECKYGRSPLIDLPLAVNPSGCARCEPRFRTYIKRSHTHTASTSGTFQNLVALSGLSTELTFYQYGGGNRQTLVSKWSQYRKMKQEWQNNIYLARSKIQGLGLYAKRDIEMNAMVIEYIGEVIRNEVAERREKLYQSHNRGIYMFRIDEEHVIDATVSGGLARYINHSCDPNCVAELFEFDREAKIIIMSCRPISKGEELTYDYQFDLEDDSSKIPCLCGAPNCQKWMN